MESASGSLNQQTREETMAVDLTKEPKIYLSLEQRKPIRETMQKALSSLNTDDDWAYASQCFAREYQYYKKAQRLERTLFNFTTDDQII
jgi:hypothetical protein